MLKQQEEEKNIFQEKKAKTKKVRRQQHSFSGFQPAILEITASKISHQLPQVTPTMKTIHSM